MVLRFVCKVNPNTGMHEVYPIMISDEEAMQWKDGEDLGKLFICQTNAVGFAAEHNNKLPADLGQERSSK